jgi:hypothetical protein
MKFLKELAMLVNKNVAIDHEKDLPTVRDTIINNGKLLKNIEGDKFQLYDLNGATLGVMCDKDVVGWIDYSPVDDYLSLDKIYIAHKFRKQNIAKMMLFWFKNLFSKSILFKGAIFADDKKFIASIEHDGKFDLYSYNMMTKEKTPFSMDTFLNGKRETAALIECWIGFDGIYENKCPGKTTEQITLSFFDDEQCEE